MTKPTKKIRPFSKEPGFTPFDNYVIDYIMPELSGSAWKVLSYFLRRTIGWQKSGDRISYSQIAKGTGIKSDTTITKALEVLIERRYMVRVPPDAAWETAFYFLNTDFEVDPDAQVKVPGGEQLAAKKSGGLASENEAAPLQKMEREPSLFAPENGDTKERVEKETKTHTRLRAVGAPTGGVCGSAFSSKFRDAYADRFSLEEGWRVRSGTGEYDDRIVSAIGRNNLYRLACTWGTEADAARIAELAPRPTEEAQHASGAPQLVPFDHAAQYVASMAQVPNYNVEGYIEQMQNVSEETRERLREQFLRAPKARTA